jgi:hypothetical protein
MHCLLSSFTNPNIFIPVKAIVKDAVWDDINSKYLVKILKFYDSIYFLKKYLFGMNFCYSFDDKNRPFRLAETDFKTVEEIENRLKGPDESRHYIVVDSVMTTKTKYDLQDKFNKVQYYLISKHLKDIKDLSTRGFYKGVFRMDTQLEFDKRLYKFVGDLFERKEENFDRYIDSLY